MKETRIVKLEIDEEEERKTDPSERIPDSETAEDTQSTSWVTLWLGVVSLILLSLGMLTIHEIGVIGL